MDVTAWTDAAAAATSLAGPHVANLQALAVLATERLSAVQHVDAAAYNSMKGSLDGLLGALNDLLAHEAGQSAGQWTGALVLGVQQLVAASRLEEAGGAYSLEGIAEVQSAFREAAKVRAQPSQTPQPRT